jgi:hypothetical protein
MLDSISLPEFQLSGDYFHLRHFSVPGNWLSPERPPRWKRIVALDGSGKEVDAQLWGGYQRQWDDTQGWWHATLDFIAKL